MTEFSAVRKGPMSLGDAIVFTSRRVEELEKRFGRMDLERKADNSGDNEQVAALSAHVQSLSTAVDAVKRQVGSVESVQLANLKTQVSDIQEDMSSLREELRNYVKEQGQVTLNVSEN